MPTASTSRPIPYAESESSDKPQWKTVGGARMLVGSGGKILAGCEGVVGHDLDSLDETADERAAKQEAAEDAGWQSAESKRAEETYHKAKKLAPDAVVVVRSGDKFFSFSADAKTFRDLANMGDGEEASFDADKLQSHIDSLIKAGHRVAVVDRTKEGEPDFDSEADPEAAEAVDSARSEIAEKPPEEPKHPRHEQLAQFFNSPEMDSLYEQLSESNPQFAELSKKAITNPDPFASPEGRKVSAALLYAARKQGIDVPIAARREFARELVEIEELFGESQPDEKPRPKPEAPQSPTESPQDTTKQPTNLHNSIGQRFRIPPAAVASILGTPVDELRQRDKDYEGVPNYAGEKPYSEFKRYPLGTAKIANWQSNPEEAYVEFLHEFNPSDLVTSEAPDAIQKRDPSYPQYVEWFKQGHEPPPITTTENEREGRPVVSSNRRRVLAAQEAGVKSIKAWHAVQNKETGLPLKYGDILKAAKAADRPQERPSSPTAEMPQESPKPAPHAQDVASRHQAAATAIEQSPKPIKSLLESLHSLREARKNGSVQTKEIGDAFAREMYDHIKGLATRGDDFGDTYDLSDELGHGAIGYHSPAGSVVMIPPRFKNQDWDVRYSVPTGEAEFARPTAETPQPEEATSEEATFPWESKPGAEQATEPEPPKPAPKREPKPKTPRAVNTETLVGKAIADAVGDDPRDQQEFRQLLNESWAQVHVQIAQENHALKELLGNFGYSGVDQSRFIKAIAKFEDPDQFSKTPIGRQWDEMVEYAQKYTPELLTYDVGTAGGTEDPESALFNRLKQGGLRKAPAKHDEEIIASALSQWTAAESRGSEHERRMSADPEYRRWQDELAATPFRREGRKIRYLRWCAKSLERWRKYAKQLRFDFEESHPRAEKQVEIAGTTYKPGEWIPKEEAAKATPAEAEKIEGLEPEPVESDETSLSLITEMDDDSYKEFKSGGVASDVPSGVPVSNWTPGKGGILFHGTATTFTKWETNEAYLVDDWDEASGYASGRHLRGRGNVPAIKVIHAKPGKTLDADAFVNSADDVGEALDEAIKYARKQGARYIVYGHPSFESDESQRVVVSLFPNEDLKHKSQFALKDNKPTKPPRELSDQEISDRDYAQNFNDVSADPPKATSRNLHRAMGYVRLLQDHYHRQFKRGEITKKENDTIIDSLQREYDWYGTILKERGDYAGGGPYSDERPAKKPGPKRHAKDEPLILEQLADYLVQGNYAGYRDAVMRSDLRDDHKRVLLAQLPKEHQLVTPERLARLRVNVIQYVREHYPRYYAKHRSELDPPLPEKYVRLRVEVERYVRENYPEWYARKVKSSAGQKSLFGDEPESGDFEKIHPRAAEEVTIKGTTYEPGQWIPAEKAAEATPKQAEKIEEVPEKELSLIDKPPEASLELSDSGKAVGQAESETKQVGGAEMSEALTFLRDHAAKHSPQELEKIDAMSADELSKLDAYLSAEGGSVKSRSNKVLDNLRAGKPAVPMTDEERKAAEEADKAKQAEEELVKAETARAREETRKQDLATNPLTQKASGEVGWRIDQRGTRLYVTGTRYGDPTVDLLKGLGAHWDPQQKAWWVGSSKGTDLRTLVDAVNEKKTAGAAEATQRREAGLAIAIPYEMSAVRDQAKKLGARWDAIRKQWLMPSEEAKQKIADAMSSAKPQRSSPSDAPSPAPVKEMPHGSRAFTRTTDMRGQGYRQGQVIKDRDGKYWKVIQTENPQRFEDGLSMGMGRDEGYEHTAYAVPLGEEESRQQSFTDRRHDLQHQLSVISGEPDDERDRPRITAQRQGLRDQLSKLDDEQYGTLPALSGQYASGAEEIRRRHRNSIMAQAKVDPWAAKALEAIPSQDAEFWARTNNDTPMAVISKLTGRYKHGKRIALTEEQYDAISAGTLLRLRDYGFGWEDDKYVAWNNPETQGSLLDEVIAASQLPVNV